MIHVTYMYVYKPVKSFLKVGRGGSFNSVGRGDGVYL